MWIDCEDLGVIEPLFTPDTPLPEGLKKNWKLLLGGMVGILALLIALPYGYKRGK